MDRDDSSATTAQSFYFIFPCLNICNVINKIYELYFCTYSMRNVCLCVSVWCVRARVFTNIMKYIVYSYYCLYFISIVALGFDSSSRRWTPRRYDIIQADLNGSCHRKCVAFILLILSYALMLSISPLLMAVSTSHIIKHNITQESDDYWSRDFMKWKKNKIKKKRDQPKKNFVHI